MKREEWQKVYMPQDDRLGLRVKYTLVSLDREPERSMSMKKVLALALVAVMALVSVTAWASGMMFSDRVDTSQLAETELEERYGITPKMQTYFSRTVEETGAGTVFTFTGIEEFAYVLGTYTVTVSDGKAEAVWSRDGESTEGGFEASAWGAEQLKAALQINEDTHSFGEVARKAAEHAQTAGAPAWEAPAPQSVPDGYQSWEHYYRTQALPRMTIAPKDALALAKEAIVQRYGLTQEQTEKLEWHDTWTDFGMVGDIPVLNVWFWLSVSQDGYTDGDGLYGASVNVETGAIEDMQYDSALAGNG